ncbi:ATP-binding protein [Actinopolymorpha pittospori]|uniref:ATP-binding protein n=1 Tax=Actinopolymorpha pittospori TaxID=648752 RepID=UPI002353B9E8|nr:ATP-binding protein [Actinopolymorpha pittospori]
MQRADHGHRRRRLDRVATRISDGQAVLLVTNSGPFVPPAEVDRLVEPFHRLGADRTSHTEGHGLGLSILQAIATTHHAAVSAFQASRRAGD